jgi:hypothetical protein
MSLERPNIRQTKVDVLQIKTQLSHEFLDARPGWLGHYVRHVAEAALRAMETDETIAFEATTVTSEFVANAEEHGGTLTDFVLAHTSPVTEAEPEAVYLITSNPAKDTTSTPGTDHRGALASDETNSTSTSGRGLLMTDAYSGHNWGQRNVVAPDGKQEIVTFAVLSPSQDPEDRFFFEDAA